MNKPNLGELQQLVLVALLRLGEGAYGASIRKELSDVAGRKLSISAIYVTLLRMEEQGFVKSYEGERPARGGRARRCFEVMPEGLISLKDARTAANRMWEGVEPLLP